MKIERVCPVTLHDEIATCPSFDGSDNRLKILDRWCFRGGWIAHRRPWKRISQVGVGVVVRWTKLRRPEFWLVSDWWPKKSRQRWRY